MMVSPTMLVDVLVAVKGIFGKKTFSFIWHEETQLFYNNLMHIFDTVMQTQVTQILKTQDLLSESVCNNVKILLQ